MRHSRIPTLAAAGLVLAGLAAAAPAAPAQETVVVRAVREAGSGGWLGVSLQTEEDAPERLRITRVFPGSPASAAGMREGDVVLRIGDRPATGAALREMSARLAAGDTVRLRVRRDDGERDVALVAAARPAAQQFAERILRIRGDSLQTRVFHLDTTLRRMGSDSTFRRHRDVVISLRADSLRAVADSLLVRVDTLRRRFTIRSATGEPRTFSFPPVDSATLERMVEAATLLEERVALGEASAMRGAISPGDGPPTSDGRTFFLEVGRRALAGAELTPMNEGLARYFSTREGLLVTRVSPSSPAGRAGLEAGDVVVRAGERAVTTMAELRDAIRRAEGGRLPLEVVRQRRRQTVELRWDAEAPGAAARTRTFRRPLPRGEGPGTR